MDLGLVAIVVIALAFDYTNGFHDAANAIATAVSTRALTPRTALVLAAVANLAGALVSTEVAKTVGKGILDAAELESTSGMVVVFSALVGAITWNLVTWYFGLPSSSSHALIGGLVGAGLAAGDSVKWHGIYEKVIIPMIFSPITGFLLAALLMLGILWLVRRQSPRPVNKNFRRAQIVSSAAMAYGHGLQDAQKTMGIIALALVVSGHLGANEGIPLWVILSAATAISLGTLSGGARIMRTLGRRVIKMDPAAGFAAQTVASSVLFTTAHFGLPVSTTHVITSSIMGVGATRRLSAVRWGVAGNIVIAWVLTIPAAAAVAALFYLLASLVVN
ncbi:MAG: inorganic phosphate transporter [Actinobacteria bacterium]|nr:inorganic phosphate transporter [Actinomycetota bacterium]MCA1720519.1 inorganic phosphate transporter [Actinomycetota bacterium]